MLTFKNAKRVESELSKAVRIVQESFERDEQNKPIGIKKDFGQSDMHNLFMVLIDSRNTAGNIVKNLEQL